MSKVILSGSLRDSSKKNAAKNLRKEGLIPAVVYSKSTQPMNIQINGADFAYFLQNVVPGHLPTTQFEIQVNGQSFGAVIKDIQYNVINYSVDHIDFQRLEENQTINVKVPIQIIGQDECPGLKAGGVVRQVIRHFKVKCPVDSIPVNFQIDLTGLLLKQAKRLSAISLPANVTALVDTNEVAVVIVKR